MELVLTNMDVLALNRALQSVANIKAQPKFSMAVARNMWALKPLVEELQAAQEMSAEMREYDAKRVELVKKYGKAEPPMEQLSVPEESRAAFDTELEPLKSEYADVIADHTNQLQAYVDQILPDLANDGEKVKLTLLPKALPKELTANQIFGLVELMPEE